MVDAGEIWHQDCVYPWKQAQVGRTHKCPQCNGSRGTTTERPVYRSEGGYNGFFDKGEEIFLGTEKTFHPCSLCDGNGYLAKEPQPIVEPAKIVGWNK